MNNRRRKELKKLSVALQELQYQLEMLAEEEQEYLDNMPMPENLHYGERYNKAEQAVDDITSAAETIDDVQTYIEEAING